MRFKRMIQAVDAYTLGVIYRIVVGSIPTIHGKTMREKMEFVENVLGKPLKDVLVGRPGDDPAQVAGLITEPVTEEADVGLFWMDTDACSPLCGAGTFAVGTVLIETGIIDYTLPDTEIKIDTPVGLINVRPEVLDGRVKSVSTRMVPSFFCNDLVIDLPNIGETHIDISFGGNLFEPIINARDLGIELNVENSQMIEKIGLMVRDKLNQEIAFQHPDYPMEPSVNKVKQVQFYDDKPNNSSVNCRCLVIVGPGVIDLTPSGTSTCAQIATLYAKGKLGLDEDFVMESVIGTTLRARIIGETKVGKYNAIIPEISGSAEITRFLTNID